MSESPAGYYTDTDAIRAALAKYGPLSRPDLSKKANMDRTALSKSLYQLKRQGDVIEEGELLSLAKEAKKDVPEKGDRVTLAKATNPAQDERKGPEVSMTTAPLPQCLPGQIKPVANHAENLRPEPDLMALSTHDGIPPDSTDVRGDSVKAVIALEALYDLADESRALLAENQRLKDWIAGHSESQDMLLAAHAELHKLKDALRGLL